MTYRNENIDVIINPIAPAFFLNLREKMEIFCFLVGALKGVEKQIRTCGKDQKMENFMSNKTYRRYFSYY